MYLHGRLYADLVRTFDVANEKVAARVIISAETGRMEDMYLEVPDSLNGVLVFCQGH